MSVYEMDSSGTALVVSPGNKKAECVHYEIL